MAWLGWRAPINALSFALRSSIGFRRGAPELCDESKEGLFDFAPAADRSKLERRASELVEHYQLEVLRGCSTCVDYRDNLALLDALERVVGDRDPPFDRVVRAVDVGSKNWSYAYGQTRFLQRIGSDDHARRVVLDGIEIDGHGVYADGYARADYGEAYAQQAPSAELRYRVEDYLRATLDPCDVVFHLFPFVHLGPLLLWGLPQRMFQPARIVARSLKQLKPGGWLIAFNQTSGERDALVDLLTEAGATVLESVSIATDLVHYAAATRNRWGTLATV